MEIYKSVQAMQMHADQQRCAGKKLSLVPTMGALHEGHLELVRHAGRISDHVTVSIFVNPTQFGPNEDFTSYPRTVDEDLAKLEALGVVDAVFLPGVHDMYPAMKNQKSSAKERPMLNTWVRTERLDNYLCGMYREGHFLGVTTVVTKLFNACRPHIGVFGLKDAQQFLVLKKMVEDLNMGIELSGVATIREKDGLAASSRNVYLTPEQRVQAPRLYEGLQLGKKAIEEGELDAGAVKKIIKDHIATHSEGVIQYIEVVDVDQIQPVQDIGNEPEVLIALAVFFGNTRLIDNVFVKV